MRPAVLLAALMGLLASGPAAAQPSPPVATYAFDDAADRYAAKEAGAPRLTAVNSAALSFATDVVALQNGPSSSRTVLVRAGSGSSQAGVALNTAGLLTNPNVYSAEIVFTMTQTGGGFRRILNSNDAADPGLYAFNSLLAIYPNPAGADTTGFGPGRYRHVVLTNDGATARVFADGKRDSTTATTAMNNPDNVLRFFLDEAGGGEYDTGSVAFVRLWNRPLSDGEAAYYAADPFGPLAPVPEPAGLLAIAAAGLAFGRRARRLTRGLPRLV